jgi:HSP20 family molecular chaperone IbpA
MEARVPPMDIVDNSDELWVYVEAPGFQPEEIRVRGDEAPRLR